MKTLNNIRPLYMLPEDPLAEELLIPAFRLANRADCMAGYFSSEVLSSLAPGLASFVNRTAAKLRLVISPLLRKEDHDAICEGLVGPDEVAVSLLENITITEDLLQQHTLKCLCWLLKEHRIEIRVALMNGALFHPKVWMFHGQDNILVVHGSSNITYAGIHANIEQIAVSCSWKDQTQNQIVVRLTTVFEKLWQNQEQNCIVCSLPDAIKQQLLKKYSNAHPPTEDELRELYNIAKAKDALAKPIRNGPAYNEDFTIPDNLNIFDGPYSFQGEAVNAWKSAEYRGVFEMATGSGKTKTAIVAAHQLFQAHKPMVMVIAVPYKPLITQWCAELEQFNLEPLAFSIDDTFENNLRKLNRKARYLQHSQTNIQVVVMSHDALCNPKFHSTIESIECHRLLIADEVHNLGRSAFISNPPMCFDFRLGLSATPIRQYDSAGTEKMLQYFGTTVYNYPLARAIGNCLVDYDYHLHEVALSNDETQSWLDLTGKIKQNAWRSDADEDDEYLLKLMIARRTILETAEAKIHKLAQLLDEAGVSNLQHTLIYTTDKSPDQLIAVNRMLNSRNVTFHQLTSEETSSSKRTEEIIQLFADGIYKILTAKRVLDEGVNIPQVCRAYILASSTVERQWVQRRGRLLRKCPDIGKTHSDIHDMIVLPPNIPSWDRDMRAILDSEKERAYEFAKLARNFNDRDGPLRVLDGLP